MRGLPDQCCNLIYIDPPFETPHAGPALMKPTLRKNSHAKVAIDSFITFLRPRLIEMRRILARRGTLWVHLDWHAVHYIKCEMDELFGYEAFVNEIIWSYRAGSRPGRWFPRKHDSILVYAKTPGEQTFNSLRGGEYRTRDMQHDDDGRPFKSTKNGRIYFNPLGPAMTDVWEIPILSTVSRERVGYPSQKPRALLERVIQAGSNEGDIVADFFCGSGTTLVVARSLRRHWLGCDRHALAIEKTRRRLQLEKSTECDHAATSAR